MEAGSVWESVESEPAEAPLPSESAAHAASTRARAASFFPEGSVAAPIIFSAVAIALVVFNYLQKQISLPLFLLGLALIACVLTWMLQSGRKQSKMIEDYDRRDPTTGLANRLQLRDDLANVLASPGDRRVLVLLELDGLRAYRDRFGYEAGDELLRGFARQTASVVEQLSGTAYRVDGSQFCALVPASEHQRGEIVTAISTFAGEDSAETPISRSHGEVTVPDDATDPDVAIQIAGQRLAAHKQRQRRSAKRQVHDVLLAVLSARRPELRAHLRVVAFRAISLGRLLGVERDQLDDIVFAAELQDIGLLTVPEAILEKQTPLSMLESELIRGAPPAGAGIISAAPALAPVATLVRSSREHFDGSGYPDRLAGEAIPLGARIIAVSVAYAALTSNRPYRPAMQPAQALAELRRCSGTQFDPRVVEALAEDLAEEVAPSSPSPATSSVSEGFPNSGPVPETLAVRT